MLPKEQIPQIKKQLVSQIEASQLPNKEELISSIENMGQEEFEAFLKQNKLIKDENECIFCSIIGGKIPSFKIKENENAIAVLEINPVSKGHVIIIPKIHSETYPKKITEFAKEIAESVKILKPKKIDIVPSKMFGHEILNVIPLYKDESLKSQRKKASEKTLLDLQKQLSSTPRKSIQKEKTKIQEKQKEQEQGQIPKKDIISDKTHWLPKRFP
jgi:diadenosine tetraphosphate (Ap4A) HIT family hydrolase